MLWEASRTNQSDAAGCVDMHSMGCTLQMHLKISWLHVRCALSTLGLNFASCKDYRRAEHSVVMDLLDRDTVIKIFCLVELADIARLRTVCRDWDAIIRDAQVCDC